MSLFRLFYILLLLDLSFQSGLKIIKSNGQIGPQPCAFTCVGTTGRYTTKWNISDRTGKVWIDVDISACNFVDVPVLTVTLDGAGHHDYLVGTSSVFHANKNGFRIQLLGQAPTAYLPDATWKPVAADAVKLHWNVNWSAFGYEC